ncbi:MAG: carboxypeptidase-like regulatory domain-containing protein [Candidatus Thermoplasmatota archaeon]|jgi:hypothetical protein|nr:carboxypeptidase-like regulatory domain-containing protein [Candidatus Thermoplasmatota archaeon]
MKGRASPRFDKKFSIKKILHEEPPPHEITWVEHGEPRKTILPIYKPKATKPKIAAYLLFLVFILGMVTAALSDPILDSSMKALSDIGLTGTIKVSVIDKSNNQSLENVTITVGSFSKKTDRNGSCSIENVPLGVVNMKIVLTGYKTQTHEILVMPLITLDHNITMQQGVGEENSSFYIIGCSVIIGIFSLFALLGSITILKKQNFDVAIACSVLGIFSFGFFFVGPLLSIMALLIILRYVKEFDYGQKGKTF